MQGGEATTIRVADLVRRLFPLARTNEVGPEDSLFSTGILDSLGVLDLVAALEDEFEITVEDDDLVPDNFQSITDIASFVRGKR